MPRRPIFFALARVACRVMLVALSAAIAAPALGQPQIEVVSPRQPGPATWVRMSDRSPIPVAPGVGRAQDPIDGFLEQYGPLFGVSEAARQLVVSRVNTDALGQIHTTLAQFERGVPVFSGMLKVHQDGAGRVLAANGNFRLIDPKLSIVPILTPDHARQIGVSAVEDGWPVVERSELVIVDPGWYGDPPRGAHLAYYLILHDPAVPVRRGFFIDAQTGEVLDEWDLLCTARNRLIHNANNTPALPGTLMRGEGDPAVVNFTEVNRAYDYAGDTYDFYQRAYGRDSIDGAGRSMIATVYWFASNSCPNAFWNGTLTAYCSTIASDDVVGHEFTHAVTEFTATLIYQNQPGQLNEATSDIFGELIDLYNGNAAFGGNPGGAPWPVHPTGPGTDVPNNLRTSDCSFGPGYADGLRWQVGEDAFTFGGAIRDMWNPPCHGDPDRANSTLQTCPASDNGGVHSGSGIPNHFFAILTDGKTFNGQTVTGIGPIKAGAVWYRALTTYFTPATNFQDAYTAANQAAADLIGTSPLDPRTGAASASAFTAFDAQQVNAALLAVEMNTIGRCGAVTPILNSQPYSLPPGRVTIFADSFENGPGDWSVFNSNPPTPYDWGLTTTALPLGRAGKAWFCADPNIGDCAGQDESAIHTLKSPVIRMPAVAQLLSPTIVFTHYSATEAGWDGCNVKIRIDGGLWKTLASSRFLFNNYNLTLKSAAQGNTNPMAGQTAWSGAGGGWGTTAINLTGLILPLNELEVRFDLGKDGCSGVHGWWVDDFEFFIENPMQDCNLNGVFDGLDIARGTSIDCNSDFVPDECGSPLNAALASPEYVQPLVTSPPLAQSLNITGGSPPYQYFWELVSGPAISGLSNVTARTPTFTPPMPGEYLLRCAVTDSSGITPCTGSVELVVISEFLAVDAGPDRSSCGGGGGVLLGAFPVARGGRPPYTYEWSVVSGSPVLGPSEVAREHPTVIPQVGDPQRLQVRVRDSGLTPQEATDTVEVVASPAVGATAGRFDRLHPVLTVGEPFRPGPEFGATDGTPPYAFEWFASPGEGVTVVNADSLDATLTPTQPGEYEITLRVTDAAGCIGEHKFKFTATPNGPLGLFPAGQSVDLCGLCAPIGAATAAFLFAGLLLLRLGVRRYQSTGRQPGDDRAIAPPPFGGPSGRGKRGRLRR